MSETVDRDEASLLGLWPLVGPACGVQDQRALAPGERLSTLGGSPNLLVLLWERSGSAASSATGRDDAGVHCIGGVHGVGIGSVMEVVTAASRCDGMDTGSAEMLARILRGNGYATGAFGKWDHAARPEEAAGPWAPWEEGEAFDAFHGFLGGAADAATSVLAHCSTVVDPPLDEQGHCALARASVERAIAWVDQVGSADSHRPWFTVLSFTVPHDPSGQAALVQHAHAELGRFLEHLARTGQIEDTLVL